MRIGEIPEDHLQILGDAVCNRAGVGTQPQVVPDGQEREYLAAFGHVSDALAHNGGRLVPAYILSFKHHGSLLRLHDARDGFQQRGLARAVGSEDGNDPLPGHFETDAPDRDDRTVVAFDVADRKHGHCITAAQALYPPVT